jgi:hypothetical protein
MMNTNGKAGSNYGRRMNSMKPLPQLKKEVFDKFSQYPKIEAFFKDSLKERIKLGDNWIENALVHNILEGIRKGDRLLEAIEVLYNDKGNFDILKKKLNPKDKDYNRKMRDVLAELNGYYHLKKFGFEEIEALGEGGQQKKPDFSARLHKQRFLFEVKNIRSPIDLLDILLDKYHAKKLRSPERYSNVSIFFKATSNWRDIRFNPRKPDELYHKTVDWLETTFQAIESPNAASMGLQPFETVYEGEKLKIQCDLKKGGSLGMIFGFKRGICISDPLTRKNYLYPFTKKLIGKVGDAIDQLLEFGCSDTCRKYVLIDWQRTSDQMFFEKEAIAIVKQIDALVKTIFDNLFVKLLNTDSLP